MERLALSLVLIDFKLTKKVILFFLDVSNQKIMYLFIFLGDGIFDRLNNDEIFQKIWGYKKKGEVYNDINELCGKITDGIIKYSMQQQSIDNVSVIFIAFKNFENKMKDPNFEYTANAKTRYAKEQYDFSKQI